VTTTDDPNLLLDFVNSLDVRPGEDAFETPSDLAAWLVERDLLAAEAQATAADLKAAKEIREAIRLLLLAHNEVEVDEAAPLAVLDAAARRVQLNVCFRDGTAQCEPAAPGVAGALGRILGAVADAMSTPNWARMKACRADDCRWVYLDTAKNRSRAWCSMSSCGNRAKVSAYRSRHTAAS
jgi:predicted RNA-binding Zn ribbon-like protein